MARALSTSAIAPFIDGKNRNIKKSLGTAWCILQRKSKASTTTVELFGKLNSVKTLRWALFRSGIFVGNYLLAPCLNYENLR